MGYISSLNIHREVSLSEKELLERSGCTVEFQPRDSAEKPVGRIIFPPGTRVSSSAPFLGIVDSVISLPTGLMLTWINNKGYNVVRVPVRPGNTGH